ncbi:hypothetical protein PVAND_006541 [Polypedilum vanderplanki]|uniref:Uncharacterized protein n=1 Tax=Polypedilum vanderplanki TaxID=319348 RepID=A0A9J6C3I2_POLVA|nr:hypothetical protein PVAND_006541 [Polypedilum vanderplanki]
MGNYYYKHNAWKKIVINTAFMLTGSLLILFWPNTWSYLLAKQWQIKPGTLLFKIWSDPPQPIYLDVYFFNWTNPHEFQNQSIKPKFNEVGPYRFQEYPQKVNVTYHDQNDTISYRKQSRFIFLPDESKGQLSDMITSINVVALSSANQARSWNIFKVKGVELSLSFFDQQIHLTKTASELLFEGYDDPIINVAKEIAKIMGITVPFDRFGYFYSRNESSLLTGDFNVDSGISTVGQLRKWNYQSTSDHFEGSCSNLEGASAGELFPPEITNKISTISVFSPEICRNLLIDFEKEINVDGITAKRFIGGDRTVDNGTKYPENKCFFSGDNVASGVLNVTACRLGAPVFMSFPHFYAADESYRNAIEGMAPNKEKHQFYMTFEPKTSLPIEIAGRFQLNVLIKPIRNINMYKNVPTKFLPVVWFEQHFKASQNVNRIIKLLLWIPIIGQIIGFLIALIGIYGIYKISSQKSQNEEISIIRDNNYNSIQMNISKVPEKRLLPEEASLIN